LFSFLLFSSIPTITYYFSIVNCQFSIINYKKHPLTATDKDGCKGIPKKTHIKAKEWHCCLRIELDERFI